MKASTIALVLGTTLLLVIAGCASLSGMSTQEIARIEPETLSRNLDQPDLIVIDVRLPSDWEAGQGKIKGSLRESTEKVLNWAPKYPKDKTIVLYCA
jgi:rhodanese-related sulfurtransferase